MTVKTTGLEFKAFYNDAAYWPDGRWHEGEIIKINGVEKGEFDVDYTALGDDDSIDLTGGAVFDESGADAGSLEGIFKKWRKEQKEAYLTVAVPKDKLESVKAAIKAALKE